MCQHTVGYCLFVMSEIVDLLVTRYQGYVSAALVLGGVDQTGPHLYSIHPHGSTDTLPYVTMGTATCLSCLLLMSVCVLYYLFVSLSL